MINVSWQADVRNFIDEKLEEDVNLEGALNQSQRNAIKLIWNASLFPRQSRNRGSRLGLDQFLDNFIYHPRILTSHQEYSGYIIIGPPGTGKTTVIAYGSLLYVVDLQYSRGSHPRVFLCTSTNYGADRICERIMDLMNNEIQAEGWENYIKRVVAQNKPEHEISENIRHLIVRPRASTREDPNEHYNRLSEVNIFIGTIFACKDLIDLRTNGQKTPIYSQTIIYDEASQLTPPQMYLPISHNTSLRSFGAVGDYCQLPPITSLEPYRISCIDFLRGLEGYENSTIPNHREITLNVQYRMHPAIRDISNRFANRNVLIVDGPNVIQRNYILQNYDATYMENQQYRTKLENIFHPEKTVVIIDTSELEVLSRDRRVRNSRINPSEVNIIGGITYLFNLIYPQFQMNNESVKLISPYKPQASELRRLTNLNSATVDAFQGQEADLVIYSLTFAESEIKSRFAQNIHRLHVALSRAMRKLIIIGNSREMNHPSFQELKENIFEYQYNPNIEPNIELGYVPVSQVSIDDELYFYLRNLR